MRGNSCNLLAHPSRSTVAIICDVGTPDRASEVVPLLGALRQCPLQELRMPGCETLTAAGWAQFRGARWTNLKIADFAGCRGLVWLHFFVFWQTEDTTPEPCKSCHVVIV